MRPTPRDLVSFACGCGFAALIAVLSWPRIGVTPDHVQDALTRHPEFLADHPELLDAARSVLQTRALASRGAARAELIRGKWATFTHPALSPTVGDPAATALLIEFTDYACAPCKTSAPVVQQAVVAHPDLRVAIVLLPTGGAMSELAARVALAAYQQNPRHFRELHRLLMQEKGQLTQQGIMDAAAKAGLDVAQIQREISGAENRQYFERARAFASDMDVSGVPAFAMEGQLILGGVSAASLGELLRARRGGLAVVSTPAHEDRSLRFALIDQHGRDVHASDFHGTWLLVLFGFTSCPDVCPTSLARVTAALHLLGHESPRVRVAMITVDPDRDTPEVLRQYLAGFDTRLVGLTGSAQQLADATAAFGAYAARQEPSADGPYSVDHSSSLHLIDPAGRFNRKFSPDTDARQLAASLKKLIAAARLNDAP
jgi:protein SCO1/2